MSHFVIDSVPVLYCMRYSASHTVPLLSCGMQCVTYSSIINHVSCSVSQFRYHIVWYAVCRMHFYCCIIWDALSYVKDS